MVYSLPCKDPSGASTIIECYEFDRIKQAAQIVTNEEKAAAAEKVRLEKEQTAVSVALIVQLCSVCRFSTCSLHNIFVHYVDSRALFTTQQFAHQCIVYIVMYRIRFVMVLGVLCECSMR